MRLYELIRANKSLLELLSGNGSKAKDVGYLPMFREYQRMMKEGHKQVYIVAFLSEEYGVSEATVYRVIYRFNQEVKM